MFNRYEDIRTRERPVYDDIGQMSRHDRAAQFSPFAALVGYGEAVDETARLTDSRPELTEDDAAELDMQLKLMREMIGQQPAAAVRYFIPDEHKEGGRFEEKAGRVRLIDEFSKELVFTDGERVPLEAVVIMAVRGKG